MIRYIDAASGIRVLVPSAANTGILFEDSEGNACFSQLQSHADSGEPSPRDHNPERLQLTGIDRTAPMDPAAIATLMLYLFEHHRNVIVRNRLAYSYAHQVTIHLPRRWLRR